MLRNATHGRRAGGREDMVSTTAPAQGGRAPIRVAVDGPTAQNRLTVAARAVLVLPQLVALYLLDIAASVVVFVGWWAALFTGSLPAFAHDFLSGVLGWQGRMQGYLWFLTDRYPPFSLEAGSYPIIVAVPPRGQLNRLAVLFRGVLVFPALLLGGFAAIGASVFSVVAWLIVLVSGSLPDTLHQAFTAALRYQLRVSAYNQMLTAEYPGGLLGDQAGTADERGGLPGMAPLGSAVPDAQWPAPVASWSGTSPAWPGADPAGGSGYGAQGYEAQGYGGDPSGAPGYGAQGPWDPAYGSQAPGYPPVATAPYGASPPSTQTAEVQGYGVAEAQPDGAGGPEVPAVVVAPTVPDVFTYGGGTYLWGYSADRAVCGIWRRDDPAAPGRTWPIEEQDDAWARFREVEPAAVAYDGPEPAALGFGAAPVPDPVAAAAQPEVPSQDPSGPYPWAPGAGFTGPAPWTGPGLAPSGPGWAAGAVPASPGWGPAAAPAAAGWGPAPAPVAAGWGSVDPRRWVLLLTSRARTLVVVFCALGLLWIPAYVAAAISVRGSLSQAASSLQANLSLQRDYASLSQQVTAFDQQTQGCASQAQPLPCVTAADATFAGHLDTFVNRLQGIAMPVRAQAAEQQLAAVGRQSVLVLQQLATATDATQYQQIATGSGLDQSLTQFDTDFNQLQNILAGA